MKVDYHKQLDQPIKLSVLMPVYNERFLVGEAITRVLRFDHPLVREIELIVVDDGSTDGTREILRRLAADEPRIRYHEQPSNRGKGAAVRRAISEASGELCVIQDADLEYYPEDWAQLIQPFFDAEADAVYGSRFSPRGYRRVLYFWHTVGNRFLTLVSNLLTDLNLTDMETCYKMVRTELLKSIPIRSDDFALEPELTAKLAKRGAAIYEVPIRYAGRTYREGKKISFVDGFRALAAILRWKLIDDIYQDDEYGAAILSSVGDVHQLNQWMADVLAEHVGGRVIELGAGIGNVTTRLVPRDRYLATDINPHYLAFLRNLSLGKPYLRVGELDLLDSARFASLAGQFDTAICLNVLEHVADEARALRNLWTALEPGGTAVVLVPQGKWLYSSLDEVLDHVKRYRRPELREAMERAGFEVVTLEDFNRVAVPGWALNGMLLRRKHFSRVQLKIYNTLTPLFRAVDSLLPWHGLSIIAIGRKPRS